MYLLFPQLCLQFAKPDVQVALVANKIDMNHKRMLTAMDGENLARRHGIPYFEASAKSNINIDKIFSDMTETILRKVSTVLILWMIMQFILYHKFRCQKPNNLPFLIKTQYFDR